MSSMQKIINALLLTGFGLCLLQIWLPEYYLTGDGPCHVYNAQILHDLWCNKNTSFYSRYYNVLYRPDPNWLSTVVLALLMFIAKGTTAEKIFLTLYVVVFTRGFYLLLRKISGNGSYWLLVIFFFVFPHELSKGFYNSSFSIAFYFWVVWSWLRFLEQKSITNAVMFFLFTTLLYFTHLLAFGFCAFTCAALVVSYGVATGADAKQRRQFIFEYAGLLAMLFAPFLLLMTMFTDQEGGLQLVIGHHFYRLVELIQFKYFVNVTHSEDYVAAAAGIILLLTFCAALTKFRIKTINKYDGLLISLGLTMFVYLFFPDNFLGRLILIALRVQPYVGILLACCIAYLLPETKFKKMAAVLLFACFAGLTAARVNCMVIASKGAADYVSAEQLIKPNSVVLPLDFAPAGLDDHGQKIADRNYLFSHASQYMGTTKSLIILDNYEANMGYFPVRWNGAVNPYFYLGKAEGIENAPPYARIAEYKQSAGVAIDYVLMWCYNDTFLRNDHFKALYAEINAGYHVAYTSPSGRTVLYELNR